VKRRAVVQLVAAGVALIGCVLSWSAARSSETMAPILEGEPAMTTMVYYPPLVVLSLALATAAGVLAVLGIAGLRRLK
jgi:hypothetical protein